MAESVTEFLFGKTGVETRSLSRDLDVIIDSYPKVSGAEPYLSSALSEAIRKANDHANTMKDKFVTAEHLLMGILDTDDKAGFPFHRNDLTHSSRSS